MLHFTMPASGQTNRCPEKPGPAHGVRKVWRQLRREGIDVARCTTARLMRQMGWRGRSAAEA
jgi:hypothetical protein